MKLLDIGAHLIQKVLGVLPPQATSFLWFPVFLTLLLIAATQVVRRLLPVAGNLAVKGARLAVVVAGAVLLALDLVAASGFRLARARPPGVVYAFGDVVTGALMGAERATGKANSGFTALAKTHFMVILLLVGLWLWAWDYGHCRGQADPGCVRPITQWLQMIIK